VKRQTLNSLGSISAVCYFHVQESFSQHSLSSFSLTTLDSPERDSFIFRTRTTEQYPTLTKYGVHLGPRTDLSLATCRVRWRRLASQSRAGIEGYWCRLRHHRAGNKDSRGGPMSTDARTPMPLPNVH